MMNRQRGYKRAYGDFVFSSLIILFFIVQLPSRAQQMPLEIRERLWEVPGPAQSQPGAPKLLIVSPDSSISPYGGSELRYMGRVEPADCAVTLNGRSLKIYPGGVFSGRAPIHGQGSVDWTFRATRRGLSTAVTRTIPIERPPQPAPAWPLAFYVSPVRPVGQYWLAPGETLPVTLYASPGARAQARIGEGEWQDMQPAGTDPDRGGIYKINLAPPPAPPTALAQVHFRLTGSSGGEQGSIDLDAPLRVGSRPDEDFFIARVSAEFASFLMAPTGWNRWGNIVSGTPAPFFEIRGDRAFVDFDHGQRGWLELEALQLPPAATDFLLPQLTGKLGFEPGQQTLRLTLERQTDPVAFVFQQPAASEVKMTLTGASTLAMPAPGNLGPFSIRSWADGMRGEAPELAIAMKGPVWGFGSEIEPGGNFSLFVRTAPRLANATSDRPLAGMRIMIDAGHGGRDPGAFGPSGLAESDVNLVEAAWLERALAGMGAEILQIRRGDDYVALDSRVESALDYDPDLFISLHHNSVPESADPTADRGPITFYHYEHSRPLAESVETELIETLGAQLDRRVQPQNFRVNRNISPCPSILVETAYLSNPADEIRLRQTEWIRQSAEAIARGVVNYMRSIK